MKILGFELETEGVYEPREDSLLLAKAVAKMARGDVLDVGTGSGLQALVASRKAERVTGVDLNEKAVKTAEMNAKRNCVENVFFMVSDLFQEVSGRFDLVIFNAPYLPEKQGLWEGSEQWAGGETGRDLIEEFSEGLCDHLKPGGMALVVVSSVTGLEEVKEIFQKEGFSVRVLKEKKIPWEMLYVLEIRRNDF